MPRRRGRTACRARQVFKQVTEQAHELVEHQYRLLNEGMLPELARHDIRFLRRTHWNDGAGRMDQGLSSFAS